MRGVATMSFVHSRPNQRQAWARRSSCGCQSSSFNIAVTRDIYGAITDLWGTPDVTGCACAASKSRGV